MKKLMRKTHEEKIAEKTHEESCLISEFITNFELPSVKNRS